MYLYKLKNTIHRCTPFYESAIKLVGRDFRFYSDLAASFYKDIHLAFGDIKRQQQFTENIRQAVFNHPQSDTAEAADRFNKLKFSLQEFLEKRQGDTEMLREILSVTTKIAAFMTYHLELHKYRRDSMTDEEIVQFIIRIDQIGIEWDNCLNRYLSYCKVIDADKDKKEVDNSLHVLFIIPENTPIDCILPGQLLDVISTVFELTCGLLGYKDKIAAPEIIGMEGGHSLYVNLKLPTPETAEVAGSFLHFLNTENIASEQMTLHGLETLRLKIGSSVTSAAMKTRAKKLILLLKKLPAGAYFSVQNKISSDDIMVISRLCRSIEEMKQTTEEGQPAKINTSETANTGTSSHIGASTQSGSSQNSDGATDNKDVPKADPYRNRELMTFLTV